MNRIAVLAVIASVAACERPSSDMEGGRSRLSGNSAVRATPGYVVDSALPPAEALRRFRAGIEATISFLKRCVGWTRCTWRSLRSFTAYAWSSVVSANLLRLARHVVS